MVRVRVGMKIELPKGRKGVKLDVAQTTKSLEYSMVLGQSMATRVIR